MVWGVQRGRYGAEALGEEEIQKLQAAPKTASDHVAGCNSCRSAARDQRATLEPLLRDLLHLALAHGHAITLRRPWTATTSRSRSTPTERGVKLAAVTANGDSLGALR